MTRTQIATRLLGDEKIPLWVPLLTHYRRDESGVIVDVQRMIDHVDGAVEPVIHSWMVAGSTGDGWDITTEQFRALLAFAGREERDEKLRTLIGTLRPTTDEVIAFVNEVHEAVGTSASAAFEENVACLAEKQWVGVVVCPPVGADVTQEAIVEHYGAICDAARMPLAVYQLPQVTQNVIEPATMARLVTEHPEIILFKDSSGADAVARAGVDLDGVILVRGAEGDYAASLKPLGGPYDGLLLSTGNVFGNSLRGVVRRVADGNLDKARELSQRLTGVVQRLFEIGGDAPVGNAFSNVNRAVDHINAYPHSWRDRETPMLFDGSLLPLAMVEKVAGILEESGYLWKVGYYQFRDPA